MTKQDYIDWAEQYRREVDILTEKINRHREYLRKPLINPKERTLAEASLSELVDMRVECHCAMKTLLERAEGIKE